VADLHPGAALGPYVLVQRLGTGGMGEVWQASSPDGQTVAVKVLPEGSLEDATARARFGREVAATQRVAHPRVQAVLDADADADRPWLATEMVEGRTLAQRVAEGGPLEGQELYELAAGLADALVAVHAAGVVHRDLSPANVVLGADGPVLVDFGIARFAEATTLTLPGTVVGTPAWMAPEQLRDDEASDAADVWSWAAVVAYAATGRPPARGSRPEVVMRRVLDGELDLDGLPAWLDPLVRRSLDPSPARRPTADELAAALDPDRGPAALRTQVLESTRTTAAPAPPIPEPTTEGTRWGVLGARAAVLVAGLVVGLVAPPLVVVLVVTLAVLAAVGLRLWSEAREQHLVVGPVTVAGAALLAAGAALSSAFGLVAGILALAALVVLFVALGGDLG
jgi:serine/threonine protein kinase